jgi:flagellar export protein FliJ
MQRFRFRFEKLLWHRGLQQELAEQSLSRSLHEEQQVLHAIAGVRTQAAAEAGQLRTLLNGAMKGGDLTLHLLYQASLRSRETALQGHRAVVATRVKQNRDAVRERRRAHEAVAQLKRQAEIRYRYEADREAQKHMDDVAGGRHLRHSTDGSA